MTDKTAELAADAALIRHLRALAFALYGENEPTRAASLHEAADFIEAHFRSPATGEVGEMVARLRDGLTDIVNLLRATDQLKANGFASDAADIALDLMHNTVPRLSASDTEAMRLLKGDAINGTLALANWTKYNAEQSDEVVYQAEKVASSLRAIIARIDTLTSAAQDGVS